MKSKFRNRKKRVLSSNPALMVKISNEIRTPLNAILGFVDLLKGNDISETSRILYLNHIRTSGNYLLELVNHITDITLIEKGVMEVNKKECRINQLLRGIRKHFEQQLADKKKKEILFRVVEGIEAEHLTIHTDEVRLYQLLVNLIENLLANNDRGTIEFGYTHEGISRLEFYVKESDQDPDRPESKISGDGSNAGPGTGPGAGNPDLKPFDMGSLRSHVAALLAGLLGSQLVEETLPGGGFCYRFSLKITLPDKKTLKESVPLGPSATEPPTAKTAAPEPATPETATPEPSATEPPTAKTAAPEPATPETAAPEPVPSRGKWPGKKILIAEDVESNFVYLQEILKPTGIEVLWARDGKEAVRIFREEPAIDLILMDILMPEMDGYEAAKVIREDNPDLPIIAQTAYNIDELQYQDVQAHFTKYMIKPIWSVDLISTLSEQFGN